MFLGFLLVIATLPAILAPESFKKLLKQLFKDENHLRSVSTWYLLVGPLAAYSGWGAGNYLEANFILLVGVLFILQGILLFFATDWYQNKILKHVLKASNLQFQIFGGLKFLFALIILGYGFFIV
jgi:uncharacterized protein YjeT (DUF2065 family)